MSDRKLSPWDHLRRRFPANEYVLLEQVRDAAGFSASRTADFIAVNTWPSRGLTITGIEMKASRADWLNERKRPEKQESIFCFCDYFYLFTTADNVASLEEIPETWGWIAIKGATIKQIKPAPKLKPDNVDRHFLCSMLKRAADKTGWIREETIEERVEELATRKHDWAKDEAKRTKEDLIQLQEMVREFEQAAGIPITYRWGTKPGEIGKAVNLLLKGGPAGIFKDLVALQTTASRIQETIQEHLAIFDKLNPPTPESPPSDSSDRVDSPQESGSSQPQ